MKTIKDLSVDHQYYCSDNNYYNNDCLYKVDTWDQYVAENEDEDFDLNLIFRWDVKQGDSGNYYMQIFVMQQRKGRFVIRQINEVDDKDVKSIIKYLTPRLNHLISLWNPLIATQLTKP